MPIGSTAELARSVGGESACLTNSARSKLRLSPVSRAPLPQSDHSGPLVLIVEDDLDTRVLYREYLSASGFRTADAHNGHQALAKAHELAPDAVVTDLAVPGMDGFEFCRALKESTITRDIPILAVTGHAEYLDQPARIAQAGIARVLSKPCAPDVIATELRRLLQDAAASVRSR
jgi:two-component system, cell cycle response regulator DivK